MRIKQTPRPCSVQRIGIMFSAVSTAQRRNEYFYWCHQFQHAWGRDGGGGGVWWSVYVSLVCVCVVWECALWSTSVVFMFDAQDETRPFILSPEWQCNECMATTTAAALRSDRQREDPSGGDFAGIFSLLYYIGAILYKIVSRMFRSHLKQIQNVHNFKWIK